MSYYSHHVFVCTNKREPAADGTTRPCCADRNAVEIRDYMKKRIKKLGLAGAGRVRLNNAGCLDRCEEGPCVVIYPEGVWYTYFDRADVDEIVDSHLLNGKIVTRLRLPDQAAPGA